MHKSDNWPFEIWKENASPQNWKENWPGHCEISGISWFPSRYKLCKKSFFFVAKPGEIHLEKKQNKNKVENVSFRVSVLFFNLDWCWEDWRQEEKRMTQDKMVGWHYQLNGRKFVRAPGDGERQTSLALQSVGLQRVGHNWATEQQQRGKSTQNLGTVKYQK